jgi:hypothetical protein
MHFKVWFENNLKLSRKFGGFDILHFRKKSLIKFALMPPPNPQNIDLPDFKIKLPVCFRTGIPFLLHDFHPLSVKRLLFTPSQILLEVEGHAK